MTCKNWTQIGLQIPIWHTKKELYLAVTQPFINIDATFVGNIYRQHFPTPILTATFEPISVEGSVCQKRSVASEKIHHIFEVQQLSNVM